VAASYGKDSASGRDIGSVTDGKAGTPKEKKKSLDIPWRAVLSGRPPYGRQLRMAEPFHKEEKGKRRKEEGDHSKETIMQRGRQLGTIARIRRTEIPLAPKVISGGKEDNESDSR